VRSGRLDRRLTLQRRTLIENDYGEPVETWTDLATVWAHKIEVRGAERYAASQDIATVDIKYQIRYRRGLTPVDRFTDEAGKVFDVIAVLEIGRREGLELHGQARAE